MKKALNFIVIITIVSVGMIFRTSVSFAGIIRDLNPSLGIRQEYDDNVFEDENGKKWDLITTLTPAVRYDLEPKRFSGGRSKLFNKISLNLSADIEYYWFNTSLNENMFTFLPSLSIDAELSDRLSAYYSISRSQTKDIDLYRDRGAARAAETEEDSLYTISWDQSYGVNYRLGPQNFYFDLGYDHATTRYETEGDKGDNRDTDTFSVVNNVKFLGKTFWIFSAEQQHATYPKKGQTNSVYNRYYTGITGQFTPKLSGTITGGYGKRRGEQKGGFIANNSLTYAFSPRLSFDLGASIDLGTSDYIDEGTQWTADVSAGVRYIPPHFNNKLTLTATASTSLDVWGDESGGIMENENENENNKDKNYDFSVGASYKMNKKMNLSAGYSCSITVSDDSNNNYTENIIYVQLDTTF